MISDKKSIFLSYLSYLFLSSIIVILIYTVSYSPTKKNLPKSSQYCHIKKIIDGDTVYALCKEVSNKPIKVRFSYIDSPEKSQITWGKRSTIFLTKLIPKNKDNIKINFNGKDKYGRYLGILFNNNININLEMLKAGMAVVYKKYNPPNIYLNAMKYAKRKKIGVWSYKGLQQNPQRYRRLNY